MYTGKLLGAVNGMRPGGTVDKSCLQSKEVWTGTTYGMYVCVSMFACMYVYESSILCIFLLYTWSCWIYVIITLHMSVCMHV